MTQFLINALRNTITVNHFSVAKPSPNSEMGNNRFLQPGFWWWSGLDSPICVLYTSASEYWCNLTAGQGKWRHMVSCFLKANSSFVHLVQEIEFSRHDGAHLRPGFGTVHYYFHVYIYSQAQDQTDLWGRENGLYLSLEGVAKS